MTAREISKARGKNKEGALHSAELALNYGLNVVAGSLRRGSAMLIWASRFANAKFESLNVSSPGDEYLTVLKKMYSLLILACNGYKICILGVGRIKSQDEVFCLLFLLQTIF